jgi:RNA polymerase sigma-70 factor (ECF subfamily)
MTKKTYNLPQMFAEMQRRYQGLIYSVIYGITLDGVESWDLTQEVFVKAYECHDFWNEGFKQKAWLVTVARNEALKYRRGLKSRLRYLARFCGFEAASDASELENRLIRADDVERLHSLLRQLDDDERQIITLRFSAEMSYQQIADEMQLKIGTVMSRLSRIKERLGLEFEEDAR